MARYTWTVLTNAKPGMEAEYNKWYDEVHIPDVFRLKTIVAAQRFRVADWQYLENAVTVQSSEEAVIPFRYLTIYEIETDDLPSVYRAIWALSISGEMMISPAIDAENFSATTFAQVSRRFVNDQFTS